MTDQILSFASPAYFGTLALLLFSRGMDFLSTWVATPNLKLEGNPFAKWMGWRGGLLFNVLFSLCLPTWPLPPIMLSAMSRLVAARNFPTTLLMGSMGEASYSRVI